MLGQLTGLNLNPLLAAIKLTPKDKIVSVKEVGIADSNFIITHLIKKIFQNNEKLCFVTFHNTLNHYQIVGKKLGYDLTGKVTSGDAVILDMLKLIEENILNEDYGFVENTGAFIENLFRDIEQKTEVLANSKSNQEHTYLVIDDLSHLLDLGISIEFIIRFITWCCNLKDDSISVIVNNHVSTYEANGDLLPKDIILSNSLSYISDLDIQVSPLKTGRSNEVSGIITLARPGEETTELHYKAYDRGIKTFNPGESLMNLLK
ncbi:hypothetical protein HHI36_014338 [Cryptolaemus montrouzieri]|uniref:Elongator complex protein 6 n=1 Tax=Cryptolaemus montrouzieri TaxID=559131 RepID=A0ABD2N3F8_9CUCU